MPTIELDAARVNDTLSLDELEARDEFVARHVGPAAGDLDSMLRTVGVASLDALIDEVVPKTIRRARPLRLPAARTEAAVLSSLREIAAENRVLRSFIGLGYSNCHVPSVILRNVLESPAWYTAYTPYQPEISQGRLEALLNFQTMVSDLTGMDIANASMLDEATAAAEAMALAKRVSKSASRRFFVANDCHPQTIAVVRTRALA
ncbi:MAG: glycine dehydrogenase (aminomethyl-transferring), partial [Burkholderiales bacterium]